MIEPFSVAIAEDSLADLRRRLAGARWTQDFGLERISIGRTFRADGRACGVDCGYQRIFPAAARWQDALKGIARSSS